MFSNPLDLYAHHAAAHPERAQASRRRLELDVHAFRIRGQQGGADGTPAAEGQGRGDEAQAGAAWAEGGGWSVTGGPAVSAASHPEAFPELSASATQAGLARAPSGRGGGGGPAFPPLSGAANGAAQQRRAPPPAASQRPTALAAARALIQPMPHVVTRPAGTTGAWGASGGRVPATVAASQALRQQQQQQGQPLSAEGGAGGGVDDGLLHRNRRFAEALGIMGGIEGQAAALLAASASASSFSAGPEQADALRLDLERPVYPRELLAWAANPATKLEVQRLEERIAAFLGWVRNCVDEWGY